MRDRDFQGGDQIRTFPFPVDLSLSGVGMRVGPMDAPRTWHADAPLDRVHRIDFHVVMPLGGGPVTHMIDFTEYEAGEGDLLWIRPGQVHRFSRTTGYRGTVLAMQPGFLPRATVEATGLYRYDLPPLLRPDRDQLTALENSLAQLEREYVDTGTLPLSLHTAVLRHTLSAFLLRLAHLTVPVGGPAPERVGHLGAGHDAAAIRRQERPSTPSESTVMNSTEAGTRTR